MKSDPENLDSFDKESFRVEFEKLIPRLATEMSDLLEQPSPRVTKRSKKKMSDEVVWSLEASIPELKVLETLHGDASRSDESYRVLEKLFRIYLRRAKVRLRRNEDAFDYCIRKSALLLRTPYALKRPKQFRNVRSGVEQLVRVAVSANSGMAETQKLIEEFETKHRKEYMRFANTIDARITSYRNFDFKRMTPRNITRLTDLYRDAAGGFESRLRLLVGLNYIACGQKKTYGELRKLGYNQLLQAVESPRNSLLHFLKDSIDRHVRNALMHGSVSTAISTGHITFVDYSPTKQKETEVLWTMSEFVRRTRNLVLTILAVMYLEREVDYLRLYYTITVFKVLCKTQKTENATSP